MFEHFAKWGDAQSVAPVARNEKAGQQPKAAETQEFSHGVAPVARVARKNTENSKHTERETDTAWDAEDWRTYFNERAGIAEFDGGLSRQQTEVRAYECCLSHWQNMVPPIVADGEGCPICSRPLGKEAVPVLRGDGGHLWMHSGCVEHFNIRRRVEARRELEKLGIAAPEGWTP